jgi:hypothetical protein
VTDASDRHSEAAAPGKGARPKNLTFMVGWMVFLGVYQIALAWRFGTFFEGDQGDLRQYYGGATLEPLYATVGVLALVIAWGGWRLRRWAYLASFVLQGLIYVLVLGGIIVWLLGKPAPVGWLLLDSAFGAYNLWWLTRPDTRRAFARSTAGIAEATGN